jgi:type IV pilus assembly protein PilV
LNVTLELTTMKRALAKDLPHSQSGFSMIEVLISILVMSFGLLGIGGLMMSGVNNSTGSDLASRATQSASEIMDAMRANSALNTATNSKYILGYGTSLTSLSGTAPENVDRLQWLTTLRRDLPGGDGKIERDPDVNVTNGYIVTIQFVNCIGTLNATEKTACVNASNSNTTHIRQIPFKFKI